MKHILAVLALPALLAGQPLVTSPTVVEGATNFCISAAGTDSYACNLPRGLGSYQNGVCYVVFADVSNTGAASVALNGLAAKQIVRSDGSALQGDGAGSLSDEITANRFFHFCYNSADDTMELMGAIPATGSSLPPFIQLFSSAQTWSVAGATHAQGTNIEVYTQLSNGGSWNRIDAATVDINKSSGDVVVTFAGNRSGRMIITQLAGANLGPSSPSDHANLQNLSYAQAGHTGFEGEIHASEHKHGGDDEVATATAAANAIPKAGGGGTLAAPWLPVMVGTDGVTAGTKGAVPAPTTSDGNKCLKGDATWGDCAAGAGGGVDGFGPSGGPYRTGNVAVEDADFADSLIVHAPSGTVAATRTGAAIQEVASEAVQVSSKDQPNGVAALDGSTKLTRATLPVMLPDEGSGGSAGAVPAPASGDAANCLKGDATWGACGSGSGSGVQITEDGSAISGAPASIAKVNFTGSGVSTAWNVGQTRLDVTIAGGSGAGTCDSSDGYVCAGDDATMTGNVSVSSGNSDYTITLPNSGSAGTTIYKLVSWTSTNPIAATTAGTSATKVVGICVANCGTTGHARIAIRGQALCLFDSAPTAGDWVLAGTSGNCLSQSGKPSAPLGLVYSSTQEGGKYRVELLGF